MADTLGAHAATPPAARSKPDPRPARFVLGAAGVAAASALATAIVLPPRPAVDPNAVDQLSDATATDNLGPTTPAMQSAVIYVVLAPGQTAPPGAVVLDVVGPRPGTTAGTGSGSTKRSGSQSGGAKQPAVQSQPSNPPVAVATPTPKRATPTPVRTGQSGKP